MHVCFIACAEEITDVHHMGNICNIKIIVVQMEKTYDGVKSNLIYRNIFLSIILCMKMNNCFSQKKRKE